MSKRIIKYTGRIVWVLITLFWGLVTWVALTPMDEYPCEAGQEDMSPIYCVLITVFSLVVFCFVWYKTRKW